MMMRHNREMPMRHALGMPMLGLSVLVLLLGGCFSLQRESPVLQQYVLGGARAPDTAAAPRSAAGFTVGLRRLDLAAYLATPAIIVRRGSHRIVYSEFHRWGEAPATGISRAISRYLSSMPAVRAVDLAPWPARSQYDFLVQLHVSRFEGVVPEAAATGEAHVGATWEIIRPRDGLLLARGVTDYRVGGVAPDDYARLVTLLDAGLDRLARDMASCLVTVAARMPAETAAAPSGNEPPAVTCVAGSD